MTRPLELSLAGVLILLALWLTWQPIAALNVSGDETAHIAAAYDRALTGRDRLNLEQPVLMKLIAGVGLRWHEGDRLGERLNDAPHAMGEWQYGNVVLYPGGREDASLLAAARAPFLAIVLLGAITVWLWSRALFGPHAGLISLALFAASPVVPALGSLVISDFLVAVFALLQCALLWWARRRDSLLLAVPAGIAGALACYAKYSGPVVVVLVPLLLLLPTRTPVARPWLRRALFAAAFGVGAGATALAIGGPHCVDAYLDGMRHVYRGFDGNYPYFALGQGSTRGFWYYFPLTLLLKSTPAELLGLFLLLLLGLRQWTHARREGASTSVVDTVWLAALPLVYLALLMLNALDWGHRYTAPLYLFAFVALGALPRISPERWRRAIPLGLIAVQLGSALQATPDPLTYFNGLFGCRGALAARCLDDSNIDWGQNFRRLASGLRQRLEPGETPAIGVWVTDDVGLRAQVGAYEPMRREDWYRPRPLLYAVSGHYLARIWVLDPELPRSPLFQRLMRGDAITRSFLVADLRRSGADSTPP